MLTPTNLRQRAIRAASLAIFFFAIAGVVSATTFKVDVAPGGTFSFSPSTVTVQPGDTVTWTWKDSDHSVTSGLPDAPDGLFNSGVKNSGATFSVTFTDPGTKRYYCQPHGSCCGMVGSVIVAGETTPTPTPTPTTLGNISTRLSVQTDDNVLIGGFIITGTQPKKVILRAIGPSLANANPPVAGALTDPMLELHFGATTLASNDNWMDAPNKQEIIDSTVPPSDDAESAILMSLAPGAYTAIVSGVNNVTGVALVEAYDLDRTVDSKLANISTRGLVKTLDNVLIGGFIVLGSSPQEVLVRAIGPSLANANPPVQGALADPILELHNPDGSTLASNDNWRSTQEAEIIATTVPPTDDLESAIVATLPPNAYTAIVQGANETTGVALVEVYALAGP